MGSGSARTFAHQVKIANEKLKQVAQVAMAETDTTSGSQSIRNSLGVLWKILTFRATREELLDLNAYDLVTGLVFTWIVGVGRYWDNPRVSLVQHAGVGSIAYVFILATYLWLSLALLFPKNWQWKRLLIFITMTSPPAILYAIPVELIYPEERLITANRINLDFLYIVAIWRVALLLFYLRKVGDLSGWQAFIGTLLPLEFIVFVLVALNLDKVVIKFMSGIMRGEVSPHDDAFMMLSTVSFFSAVFFFPTLAIFLVVIIKRWKSRKQERGN
jgi:hypothetical protein